MVVLYLLSIQSAVFDIAQLYAATGFLRLRTSLKMPLVQTNGLLANFNPNMETEWNHEAIEYNECLYEHRDHTNFIAFTTLDDIIISSPTDFKPLAPIFTNLSIQHPDSPEFLLRVHDSYLKNLDDITNDLMGNNIKEFTRVINDFWTTGIFMMNPIADPKPTAPEFYTKIVVIPDRVEVVWLHRVWIMEPGGKPLMVPYKDAQIMHLRHLLETGYNNTLPKLKQLNTDNAFLFSPLTNASKLMIQHLRTILIQHTNLSNLIERLPRTESFMNQFRKFNAEFHIKLNKIRENSNNTSQCSNYLHHDALNTKQMDFGCVNANNKWKWEKKMRMRKFMKRINFNCAILEERLLELNSQCTDF